MLSQREMFSNFNEYRTYVCEAYRELGRDEVCEWLSFSTKFTEVTMMASLAYDLARSTGRKDIVRGLSDLDLVA